MAGAIENLEKVADLDSHPDGLRALMQAYLQTGRLPEAGHLAAKLCTVHNDTGAIIGYADALMAAGHSTEVLQVYQQYCDRLVATDSGKSSRKPAFADRPRARRSARAGDRCSISHKRPATTLTSPNSTNCSRTPACKPEILRKLATTI